MPRGRRAGSSSLRVSDLGLLSGAAHVGQRALDLLLRQLDARLLLLDVVDQQAVLLRDHHQEVPARQQLPERAGGQQKFEITRRTVLVDGAQARARAAPSAAASALELRWWSTRVTWSCWSRLRRRDSSCLSRPRVPFSSFSVRRSWTSAWLSWPLQLARRLALLARLPVEFVEFVALRGLEAVLRQQRRGQQQPEQRAPPHTLHEPTARSTRASASMAAIHASARAAPTKARDPAPRQEHDTPSSCERRPCWNATEQRSASAAAIRASSIASITNGCATNASVAPRRRHDLDRLTTRQHGEADGVVDHQHQRQRHGEPDGERAARAARGSARRAVAPTRRRNGRPRPRGTPTPRAPPRTSPARSAARDADARAARPAADSDRPTRAVADRRLPAANSFHASSLLTYFTVP